MFFKLKIDYLKFSERLCIANDTMGLTRATFFCPKKIEQDLNKPHPKYSKLSPSCQLSSSGGWLLPGFSQTVKMLWRACDQPSTKVVPNCPNCQEATQRQQFILSQHSASHWSSVHPATQSLTKPGNDRTRVQYKRREVDLVPLDAIEVVTVQVKTAIENGRLARLWEKGVIFHLVQSPLSLWEIGWLFSIMHQYERVYFSWGLDEVAFYDSDTLLYGSYW